MAKKDKWPVTPAIRALRASEAAFTPHLYDYVERGGTAASSAALGVDEHIVIKTLVFEDDKRAPLVVLMHGDLNVATGVLAKQIARKKITSAKPEVAQKHSGYQVGGTSPFGLRSKMPVFAERSIEALPRLFINGGKRGFLLEMSGAELARVLAPTWVDAAG